MPSAKQQSASRKNSGKTKTSHAYFLDKLATCDALELSQKIRADELCPNELVKTTIARSKKIGKKLNAIESELYDLAFFEQKNQNKDSKRVFAGIPTFMKDNVAVRGLYSGYGSEAIKPFKDYRHDPYGRQFLK